MRERALLDCTLRDGGYINDWEFGHDKIKEIFQRLVSSGVEYIELGFLDERRPFDINRTIMPDTESANKILAGVDKGNAIVLGMIDYGTCSIDNLQPAKDTVIDGIRVIFKEYLMYEAMHFCKEIKALGYKVFAQMVSVTTYTDEKLKEYAELANSVMPYATSMVDTYGLLDDKKLLHIYNILDKYLDPSIKEGYHAHNNFQLGYSNCRAFLDCGTKRDILVDGTIYGMGKSAGNAPIELLMKYMNENFSKHYDVFQILEAIDNAIMDIYQKQYWGYNMFFYIASTTGCHPNYVSYLMNKKSLSVKQIMELLNSIVYEKKLMYDAKYAEELYINYQSINCDDRKAYNELKGIVNNRNVLLIGPGSNIQIEKNKVLEYINRNNPLIISVNYAPSELKTDYIFLSKSKRYTQLLNDLDNNVNENAEIIATSNVTKTSGRFKYVLNYSSLIDTNTEIIDNSLVMLLKALMKMRVSNVALAGFDGYSKERDNHFNINREYSFVKEKSEYLNKYMTDFLLDNKKSLSVKFITSSKYCRKVL